MRMMGILQTKHAKALAAAEAIHQRGETENRLLMASEQAEWDRLMGELDTINARITEQRQMQDAVTRRTNMNAGMDFDFQPVFDSTGAKPYKPGGYTDAATIPGSPLYGNQPRVILPTLKAYSNPRAAFDDALWFIGRVRGDSAALDKYRNRCDMSWLATQNENSPAQGGYLVPPGFANAVMVSRQDVGALRKLARIVPMTTDTFTYPKLTDSVAVQYPGEEGSITASNMDFGRVNLVAKKRAVYTLVSNELREDNAVALMDLLTSDMGHALAKKEDEEGITGDGTSTYGGVMGILDAITLATASVQAATTGNDTWPELTFTDFGLLMSKLPAKYRAARNLKFLCSPAFKWGVMDRLSLAQGGALAQDIVDGQPVNRFLGYEVVLSDDMPATTATNTICVIFGNFERAVLFGERSEVRVQSSEHIAFQTDQTAVRATVRYDTVVHEEGDTTNAGAIVALKTAS